MGELFELITYPLSLPLSPIWDWIIMMLVGVIAFIIAYRTTGIIKSEGGISNGGVLSLIHWSIRFFVYFGIWGILCEIIKAIQWIINVIIKVL